MTILARVSAALDRFAGWTGRIVAWLTLAMVIVGVWNTLGRWAGRYVGVDLASNAWIEAQWYMFSLLFLLGAAYTLERDAHVRVDVVYGRMSERAKAWIDLVGSLAFAIPFCVAAIAFAWPSVLESWEIREVSPDPDGLPRWPLKAVVPVAFVLVAMQAVSETLKRILVIAGREEARDADEEGS